MRSEKGLETLKNAKCAHGKLLVSLLMF